MFLGFPEKGKFLLKDWNCHFVFHSICSLSDILAIWPFSEKHTKLTFFVTAAFFLLLSLSFYAFVSLSFSNLEINAEIAHLLITRYVSLDTRYVFMKSWKAFNLKCGTEKLHAHSLKLRDIFSSKVEKIFLKKE